MMDACVQYINLTALIPKLNKQELLTFEDEEDITNDRLKVREKITRLLECIRKKKDGWNRFLTALESETTHKGHATLLAELKRLPSIEGRQGRGRKERKKERERETERERGGGGGGGGGVAFQT